jgi:small subunit ribosomal protein S10
MNDLLPLNKVKPSKINFKFKSFHHKIFEKALDKILKKTKSIQIKDSKLIALPTKIQRYTVLRSPHIDKKSREQFEIKHFNRLLSIKYNPTDSSEVLKIKFLINYIKNSCAGCQLKITYINK